MTPWKIAPSTHDRFTVGTSSGPASRAAFFAALADDRSLRSALTDTLRTSTYAAFAWETPAFSAATADLDAVFAIIDNPALARVEADP